MTNYSKNVTYIDELQDLSEDYNRPIIEPSREQLNSKIRQFKLPDPQSGMNIRQVDNMRHNETYPNKIEEEIKMNKIASSNFSSEGYNGRNNKQSNDLEDRVETNLYDKNISCLQISRHIRNCPICSKFYYNNDKVILIVVIIILITICVLLANKLFNMLLNNKK